MRTLLLVLSTLFSPLLNAQTYQNTLSTHVSIDQRPVSNQEWSTFMEFMKNDPAFSDKDVVTMTPQGWSPEKLSKTNSNLAVTGVSWQQANRYCEWRSELLTYLHTHTQTTNYVKMRDDNRLAKTYITYRLPTGTEYTQLMQQNKTANKESHNGFRAVSLTQTRNSVAFQL
jgi:formylglycine-generating enzyme required for sulfatase activity